jgi:hypothetical protein
MGKKPFDSDLYDADDDAKYLIIDWLFSEDFYAWVNPDKYGIDVLAMRNMEHYGFEVEVKHNWSGRKFPYDTVHFSARKQKFIAPGHYFTMLNDDRSCVLVVDDDTMASARVVSKNTKYTTAEQFLEVSVRHCPVFRLD